MNYREFKDVQIAEVGLGTWQLGSADWGVVDNSEALNILKAYTDAGGNFIDTADVYGMGVSETVIGEFLRSVDKDIYVATKLGRRGDEGNGWPQNFTYDAMKRHTEESLQHLGLSQLFLQQLHCIPTEEMRSGKVFDNLRKLQQEGLIQYFGASVETSEEALICLEQEGLASLQIIFNLFRQHVADEVFAKAKEKGVALIVRVPLASGLLSGKFNADTQFEPKDHRNFNANGDAFNAGETFSGIDFKQGVKLAEEMKTMLPDDRMAQWAIRWILDHPEVTTVIPGASKISQVNNNVEASTLKTLSADVHQQLRKLYDEEIKGLIRGHY
ncbi:aldo/keto reductase [Mucilaginibacter terrae]|uniref:Aryl-alcohol dehydrogenase-like predicted oxidoreductase n=1 Tax=Mucilaginibacter terrae TaxID=1955052 RepID=A0ABU3GZH6_9SPHI|nr:aldo/keto reductase [Mucilaginibacter terrae]MDT3405070.1 aryl-alcohol dehydrogenase-like predicted oxidoreductase [Mucilaginibacter terrae]